jgi:hypothetical protein
VEREHVVACWWENEVWNLIMYCKKKKHVYFYEKINKLDVYFGDINTEILDLFSSPEQPIVVNYHKKSPKLHMMNKFTK